MRNFVTDKRDGGWGGAKNLQLNEKYTLKEY